MTPENKYAEALKAMPEHQGDGSDIFDWFYSEYPHINDALTLAAKYGPAIELVEKGEAMTE